ncbi:metallophosphoesterase family protein [candidate division FCPU426 bacterium]|nr:metallophosphoesterase family protein [candidate division FCPU426 bacterium]
MHIAVVSDLHANWEAWTSVLADIQAHAVDAIYCLGDVIGYGAEPTACLQSVTTHCDIILQGNHEYAVLHPQEQERMNFAARRAAWWTRQQLSEGECATIAQWPLTRAGGDSRLVHGSPENPVAFHYITSPVEVKKAFQAFWEPLCFIGHTHSVMVAEELPQGNVRIHRLHTQRGWQQKEQIVFPLSAGIRYVINAGSVGQPRDEDPRARWILVRSDEKEVIFNYIPYNILKTQQKIISAGLPEILAQRLQYGR